MTRLSEDSRAGVGVGVGVRFVVAGGKNIVDIDTATYEKKLASVWNFRVKAVISRQQLTGVLRPTWAALITFVVVELGGG